MSKSTECQNDRRDNIQYVEAIKTVKNNQMTNVNKKPTNMTAQKQKDQCQINKDS